MVNMNKTQYMPKGDLQQDLILEETWGRFLIQRKEQFRVENNQSIDTMVTQSS